MLLKQNTFQIHFFLELPLGNEIGIICDIQSRKCQEYGEEAISTIKILELASDMGIPIYTFDSSNADTIYNLLNLSSSTESAIYTAVVSNGHEVTVPRDNITYYGRR